MQPFKVISHEITQHCNAKCYYCPTGRLTRSGGEIKRFIDPDIFEKNFTHMLSQRIISQHPIIDLFNKGEPFLHPQFAKIIDICNHLCLRYNLSTNASIYNKFHIKTLFRNCERIIFSMPGMSQHDYNLSHGFNAEKIKDNIVSIIRNMRECGFTGDTLISFHMYKHNRQSLEEAERFAAEHAITLHEYPACIIDYPTLRNFLSGSCPPEETAKIKKELWLHEGEHLNTLLSCRPKQYWCEQNGALVLDVLGNIRVCCNINMPGDEYILGSIFDMTLEKLYTMKKSPKICIECRKYKIDYYFAVLNKFRASDINRLYKQQVIEYIPHKYSLSRIFERIFVYLYLKIIQRFGYFNYYMNKLFNTRRLYRMLIRSLQKR